VLLSCYLSLCCAHPSIPFSCLLLFPPSCSSPISFRRSLPRPSPPTLTSFLPLQQLIITQPRSFFVIEKIVLFASAASRDSHYLRAPSLLFNFLELKLPFSARARSLFLCAFYIPQSSFRPPFSLRVRLFPQPAVTNSWPHTAHLETARSGQSRHPISLQSRNPFH
jgi:hypothetical protein